MSNGCWLESTGTINNELLGRFLPGVAEETYLGFARFQLEDGMIPYKITADGAGFRQIQLVTPLARCIWHHYQLNGKSKTFLSMMYNTMVRYDEWLMKVRNTRRTGCIEAFSAFDTGHDLSPRFWHVSDTPHLNDATKCNPHSPILSFLAIIRAAHAFEHHRRYVEQLWTIQSIVAAMTRITRFSQTISPWTGAEGFTEQYSPAILCVLDFVERLSGILPTKEETIWFTGVLPYDAEHGEQIAGELVYRRKVKGHHYEFVHQQEQCEIWQDNELIVQFPAGLRAVLDLDGKLISLIGMQYGTIDGLVKIQDQNFHLSIQGNEKWDVHEGQWQCVYQSGVITPSS